MEWWIWILCGLALVAAEMLSASFFLIFFGIGAIVTGALVRLNLAGPAWMEWLWFSVISLVALLLFRKKLLQKFRMNVKQDVDTMLGELATAADDIGVNAQGRAELRGTLWTARNIGAAMIERGQSCVVDRVDGIVLLVRPQ